MRSPTSVRPDRILRLALLGNAVFSTVSGLACLALRDWLASRTGLGAGEISSLGIVLLVFAALLVFLETRRDLRRPWIRATVLVVAGLDVLWVAASAVAIFGPSPLTNTGRWLAGVVALVVADFAFFQLYGWWRLRRSPTGGAALGAQVSGHA